MAWQGRLCPGRVWHLTNVLAGRAARVALGRGSWVEGRSFCPGSRVAGCWSATPATLPTLKLSPGFWKTSVVLLNVVLQWAQLIFYLLSFEPYLQRKIVLSMLFLLLL